MKKIFKKYMKNEKGMTLIELLAVIVIIAIIAAIAIPAIGNIIQNSRQGAVKADFQQAIAAANLYKTEVGSLPAGSTPAATLTLVEDYLDDPGSLEGVTFTDVSGQIAVSGTAEANGATYTVSTLTNSQLSDVANENFTGTIDATDVTGYVAPTGG